MDILGFQSSSFKLFLQNSSGEFNLTSIQVKSASRIIQVGDLNSDGLTDIANIYGSSIEIVYQHPNTGFSTVDTAFLTVPTSETSYLDGFNIADINSDGRMDIAMVYGGNMGHMKLIYQTADGKLSISNAKTYKTYDAISSWDTPVGPTFPFSTSSIRPIFRITPFFRRFIISRTLAWRLVTSTTTTCRISSMWTRMPK
jgi:hypothetical protein